MSLPIYIGLSVVLAIVAAASAMIGIGGGVLYTPLQVLFGVDIHQAAATSLFLIVILSFSATRIYHRSGKVDWSLAVVLEIFTASGGFLGGYLSFLIPSDILTLVLIATLILAGVLMLFSNERDRSHLVTSRPWYVWNRNSDGRRYSINLLIAIPVSFIAGALSGTVGIGGGILKVPMMALLLGVPLDIAIATSAFMVGITALGGFGGHWIAGHWDWRLSLILAPAVFLGAWLGAHIMIRVNKRWLKRIFGIIVIMIAVGLITKILL